MRIRDPDSIQNSFREYVTATEETDTVAYHAVLRYSSSGIEPVCGSQLSKTQFLQYSKTEKSITTFKNLVIWRFYVRRFSLM